MLRGIDQAVVQVWDGWSLRANCYYGDKIVGGKMLPSDGSWPIIGIRIMVNWSNDYDEG